jgi:hypothetical protein
MTSLVTASFVLYLSDFSKEPKGTGFALPEAVEAKP